MCIRATKKDNATGEEVPLNFIGDGKYHNYTIVWHTGGNVPEHRRFSTDADVQDGYVDFYIDDYYLGTNNAFAPTRGGKFFIAHWYPNNRNHLWNGASASFWCADNAVSNVCVLV